MKTNKILALILSLAMIMSTMGIVASADIANADVWDGTYDTSWYDENNKKMEYTLTTAEQFAGFAKLQNEYPDKQNHLFQNVLIKLDTDIDLCNLEWAPIGFSTNNGRQQFTGMFDGQGHTIYNLYVPEKYTISGLFGQLNKYDSAYYIKNVTIVNANVANDGTSKSYAGALVGRANGYTIENCHVKGNVDISGYSFVGGLLGHSQAKILDCTVEATGTITANNWQCGGLVGAQWVTDASSITNCSVSSDETNGGLTISSYNGAVAGIAGIVVMNGAETTTLDSLSVADISISTTNAQYGTGYIASGYAATNSTSSGVVVTNANNETITPDDAGDIKVAVAKIGDKTCYSLSEAFEVVTSETAPVTIELLPGEISEGTIELPLTMNNVTIKGASSVATLSNNGTSGKTVIKDTVIQFSDKANASLENITFDGIVFDNSRIYVNSWKTGVSLKNWTITNCEFSNIFNDSTYGIGGAVQFNLSSNMIYSEWINDYCADCAIDGLTFEGNVINGVHSTKANNASALYITAAEGKISIANNIFNDVDSCAITLQNLPETAVVDINDNTMSNANGSALINLSNNKAQTELHRNVMLLKDENQVYFTNVSTEIEASANFFGIGTSASNAVVDTDYADKMSSRVNVGAYYEDSALQNLVVLGCAKIGDSYFADLKSAAAYADELAATTDEQIVIEILDDITMDYGVRFLVAKDVKFVGNDKTITLKDDPAHVQEREETGKSYCNPYTNDQPTGFSSSNGSNAPVVGSKLSFENLTFVNDKTNKENGVYTSGHDARARNYTYAYADFTEYKNVNFVGGVAAHGNTTFDGCTFTEDYERMFALFVDEEYSKAGETFNTVITNSTFAPEATAFGALKAANAEGTMTYSVTNTKITNFTSNYAIEGGKNTTVILSDNTIESPAGIYGPVRYAAGSKVNGVDVTEENLDAINKAVAENNTINANAITLKFEQTMKNGKWVEGSYDINLYGNGDGIYEFASAEFTFDTSKSKVASGESTMNYTVKGLNGVEVIKNPERNDANADDVVTLGFFATNNPKLNEKLSGEKVTIGNIVFDGKGDIKLEVSDGYVIATKYDTFDEAEYTTKPDAIYRLNLGTGITGDNVALDTRKVVINVEFEHDIDADASADEMAYKAITVTLKDSVGEIYNGIIDIKDANTAKVTFDKEVLCGVITVTLKADGFRTYTYQTTFEDAESDFVLNFWNSVKRQGDWYIEAGEDRSKMMHNFLVGDIAMDYIIDKYDLAAVTSYYGNYDIKTGDKYVRYDLNRDHQIDILDVAYVLHGMGN